MSSEGTDSDTASDTMEMSRHTVLDWYSRLYSRRVDIVGDYAGNELFLIEGDSLLLHCFSDEHIDIEKGFQHLHAAWTVEHCLRGLISRRANFHIVFFNQHRELCIPPSATPSTRPKYLLARAAIIRHLSTNLKASHPEVQINVFQSLDSDTFTEYLNDTDFYFFLCHDGASSGALRKRTLLNNTLDTLVDEEKSEDEEDIDRKIALRQLIHWFMAQSSNVVLINGLEFQDARIIATVLENFRPSGAGINNTVIVCLSVTFQPQKIGVILMFLRLVLIGKPIMTQISNPSGG